MNEEPQQYSSRKNIRLREFDYSRAGGYFITICTHQHSPIFGTVNNGIVILNRFGGIIEREWKELPNYYSNVESILYIVMPNHFHAILHLKDMRLDDVGARFIAPAGSINRTPTLGNIVRTFKARVTYEINRIRNTPQQPVWQRNYYEHIIRNDENYRNICEYIYNNPAQWSIDQENQHYRM